MPTKKMLFILLTSILFLSIACNDSNDYGAPGKQDPLNFDETKKTLDYKMQTTTFTAERAFFGVSYIREIIGPDTIGYYSFYYKNGILEGQWTKITDSDTLTYYTSYPEKEEIEGDWYKINTERKTVIVDVFENQSDKTRELILSINAGNTGETLYIIQNKK